MASKIFKKEQPIIIENPFEVIDDTLLDLYSPVIDNLLIVYDKTVYLSIRFNMKKNTTGSIKAMKFKNEYYKYLPLHYNYKNSNGVIFPAFECWNCESNGMVYIGTAFEIGLSGGFFANKTYIGNTSYIIN